MAQRKSGYERQTDEFYPTPSWVVAALAEHVALANLTVWEPAAGGNDMALALEAQGARVRATDLRPQELPRTSDRRQSVDFLSSPWSPGDAEAIITNPPFGLGGRTAVAFAERGLAHIRRPASKVRLLALLLSVDFDSASTRVHLFSECPEFALKVVLLKRIRWFEGPSGPSTNHAWFVYQRREISTLRPAALAYAPKAVDITLNDL